QRSDWQCSRARGDTEDRSVLNGSVLFHGGLQKREGKSLRVGRGFYAARDSCLLFAECAEDQANQASEFIRLRNWLGISIFQLYASLRSRAARVLQHRIIHATL